MRSLLAAFILLASLSVAACSTQSPADQIAQEANTSHSWAESVRMLCEKWLNGEAPTPYARRSLETAQRAMRSEIESFRKSSVPEDERGKMLGQMQALENLFAEMRSAIEQGDRARLTEQYTQMAEIERQIDSLKPTGASQQ